MLASLIDGILSEGFNTEGRMQTQSYSELLGQVSQVADSFRVESFDERAFSDQVDF